MQIKERNLCYKLAAMILVLALLVPVMAACDDDDDEPQETTTATVKTTDPAQTTDPASTEIPFVDDPVKIGVIIDYSGPGAMAGWLVDGVINFAEWYWNEQQGGIRVGDVRRPVEFVKYDNKGQVAEAGAAARKAVIDGVVVVTMGGASSNVFAYPIADITDPEKVLYSTFLNEPELYEEYDWMTCSFYNLQARAELTAKVVVEELEAGTVGILCLEMETDRKAMDRVMAAITKLDPDIEFVVEKYVAADVKDFSSVLTSIKQKEPDVLVGLLNEANSMTVARQIIELGGWGDIRFVANSEGSNFTGIGETPGADGWYTPFMYLHGSGTEAQLEFSQLWAQKCEQDSAWCKKYSPTGSVPLTNHPVIYTPLLTAIKAIELAGSTDREKVAEAALSGLEYDSPMGYLKIGEDGQSNLTGFYVHWENGVAVPIEWTAP